jgi:rubrerythrin
MDFKTFNDIIDFAIIREKQAVKFYQVLQQTVKFEGQRQLMTEFEKMEQGHIGILQGIRQKKTAAMADVSMVQNLRISDYLVEGDIHENITYQEIIILAMKREQKALLLYTSLAGRMTDAGTKQLFMKLAAEEAKHKLHFEKIYDDEILKEN